MERREPSVTGMARVMFIKASISNSLVLGPNLVSQQPSIELGQCSDWQESRRDAFRHNISAAKSCAFGGVGDLSAASMIRIATSVNIFSLSMDQESTSRATARSARSRRVSDRRDEATDAGWASPERDGNSAPACVGAP